MQIVSTRRKGDGRIVFRCDDGKAYILQSAETAQAWAAVNAPYVAKAVHFDGSCVLSRTPLNITNSRYFALSTWIKTGWGTSSSTLFMESTDNNVIINGRGAGLFETYLQSDSGNDSADQTNVPMTNAWHHLLIVADTGVVSPGKILKSYIDRTSVSGSFSEGGIAFTATVNGRLVKVANVLTCDLADFRVMFGTNLLVDGVVPSATLDLFVSSAIKPVDPTTATAALGASAILFSGDATTFGTNQGTGGVFTLTGTLTNASTSPSG